jgi:ATP-dependent DNA ligase
MTIKSEDFMLCESITEEEAKLMNDKDFTANTKFDGERVIAVVMNNQAVLINRRGHLCNFNFEEVVEDISKMPDGIYDGEVISHCDTFNKLQRRAGTRDRRKQAELKKEIPVKYMVFDMLNTNKQYITSKPLRERVDIMTKTFQEFDKKFTDRKPCVEMAEYKPIKEMLEKAHKEDREGIVIKGWNMPYEHKRSKAWLKCKFFLETTIKICRYTENPKGIRAEDNIGNSLQIAGEQSLKIKELLDNHQEVEIFIQYLEMTENGRYRFPSFRGIKETTMA